MANRTACCLALSFLMGILYAGPPGAWAAGGMLLFCIGAGAAVAAHYKERPWRMLLLRTLPCLLLFFAGAAHMDAARQVRDGLAGALTEGERITVRGRVCHAQEKEGKTVYHLEDARVFAGGKAYPCFGVLVYSSSAGFHPGNILEADGTYAPFQISRNEGNFNEKQYYQSKKIEFRVFSDEERLASGEVDKYAVFLGELREKLEKSLVKCMDAKDAGVMANITLGEKSLLDAEVKSLYQDAGISHILAISGLHVSLFGMGAFWLLQKLRCPAWAGAALSAGAAYSFGLMSGMEVSAARAVCMFSLMMAARMSGRSYDSATALAVSAGLQAWENPFVLWNTGFLLSYGAVLGATVAAGTIRQTWRSGRDERACASGKEAGGACASGKARRAGEECASGKEAGGGGILSRAACGLAGKLRDTVFMSFCIQLTTLPLSLYYYYGTPSYGILTNACVLPFMGVLLSLGAAGAFAGLFSVRLGTLILTPAGWLLSAYERACEGFLDLPGATLLPGRPPLWLAVSYYAVLFGILWILAHGGKKKWLAGIAASLLALFCVRGGKGLEIVALDVGQGDGIYIQAQDGARFFIDGGSSDVRQVGKYRILPFLKARGAGSIKGWIVSHADADHVNGLEELLEDGYPVEYLIVPEGMRQADEAERELLTLAKRSGCHVLYAAQGMKFGSETLTFTVLYPGAGTAQGAGGQAEKDRNAGSLVVSMESQGLTGIFTGDIGEAQEREILEGRCLEACGVGKADFYKAAHHGSNGSNSLEFLQALSPSLSVISCGEGNTYGHPGAEAVGRMEQAGSRVFCTMEAGQISMRPEDGGMRVWRYLEE